MNKPESFHDCSSLAAEGNITEAMTLWQTMARREWACVTGTDLAYKTHKFCWPSAASRLADPQPRSSFASRLWRYVATTAKEAQQLLNKDGGQKDIKRRKAVEDHIKDLRQRTEGRLGSLDENDKWAISQLVNSLSAALTAQSAKWCASISDAARKKSDKLETAEARKN